MKEVKKIKKRRFNILKFLIFILFLYILFYIGKYLFDVPIKNIIIENNNYLNDEVIIEKANIENYPSFIKTSCSKVCDKVNKLELIDTCECKKQMNFVFKIKVTEKKILYRNRSNNKYMLSSGEYIELNNNYNNIPSLINYITDDIEEKTVKKFVDLSFNTIYKISEIEYSPTSYDNERFILYMRDENTVYITLSKTDKLNKYDEIKKELDNHKGILYLDSGNYFEIKE